MPDSLLQMDFHSLVSAIKQVDVSLAEHAYRAINVSLTLRNWSIGAYIAEYELSGLDRAIYGESLLTELSNELRSHMVSNTGRRQLYNYVAFYRIYPQLGQPMSAQLHQVLPNTPNNKIVRTASALFVIAPEKLLNNLSYSHFELLVNLSDDLQRAFYEAECISGNWSVRELKRQIGSLYYERSGLSTDKKKLASHANSCAEHAETKLTIRDPYIFEFLSLKPHEVMRESDLEDALLDNIQDFLLELGNGFCFEARQRRILIGTTHYYIDLVFYHRLLKCHVLVELKIEAFTHENLGQLNTYVNWYRENMMTESDNPPVGILLCTQKDHALVEYALAGITNQLFVSKYQLELPKQTDIQRFIEEKIRDISNGA
ncbi:MAG: PDDEXK nuclease domain-containing protein [Armatimonadota bacterium]